MKISNLSISLFRLSLSLIVLLICPVKFTAQKSFFGEEDIKWENGKPPIIPTELDKYVDSDLIILDEIVKFYFYARNNEKVIKKVLVKINNANGLAVLQHYTLPESFDYAHDACLYKQGRQARIKTPYIYDSKLKSLGARKFDKGRWSTVALDYKYETVKWIGGRGEFLEEDITVFKFNSLQVGDIVEIMYELQFDSDYGSNLFYFNGAYPKLNCEYEFVYKVNQYMMDFAYLFVMFIPDSTIKRSMRDADSKGYLINTDKIKLTNLKPINYPANSFESKSLPHVFVDFNFYRVMTGSYSTNMGKVYEFGLVRSRNFEWLILKDTTNYYTKIYDRQFASIRKFVATLPPIGSDSTHKTFFKALCDTFNNFRYITINHLFYNESNLYDISSGDHLLKRRLVGSTWKLCRDILNDNKLFYYRASIQDRRYGEHSMKHRAHYGYERDIIALPSGNSYIYFMPRYAGVKYHLNELPFYYEGSLAALSPENFQDNMANKQDQYFKFIKTHQGTVNENTRTENATVKISLDSLIGSLTIKESLSGQFSTVLRHLYLRDYIDSTIAPYYFKRCVDKPGLSDAKIKLSSNMSEFPFRYNFNCSAQQKLKDRKSMDLNNWFSFLLSKSSLPEAPTHDYFMDFEFSDAYNFLLEFGKPVEIANTAAFSKKINSDLFELESEIVKSTNTAYLLRVRLAVKQRKIPLEKTGELMNLVAVLNELNAFSLQLVEK